MLFRSRPSLEAALAGGVLTLRWPAWAPGYALRSATNLAPPVAWTPVTNAVSHLGGAFSVALPTGASRRFFQLQSP